MWSLQMSLKVITHLKICAGWVGLQFFILAFPGYTHLLFKKEPVHEQSQWESPAQFESFIKP